MDARRQPECCLGLFSNCKYSVVRVAARPRSRRTQRILHHRVNGSAGSTIVRIGDLVDNSGINHVTQQRAVSQTLRWRLHHRQNKHLLFRIDPKGRSARATPIVFPWRAVERGNTGIAPHGKAEAKTVPWSGRIIWPRHYSTAEVIAGHIRDGFRPKYLLTM